MDKLLFGLAIAAAVIGWGDLDSPKGSRAQVEAGILFLLVPVFLALGLWARHRAGKRCPKCAERVKRAASVCRHCGADLSQGA